MDQLTSRYKGNLSAAGGRLGVPTPCLGSGELNSGERRSKDLTDTAPIPLYLLLS